MIIQIFNESKRGVRCDFEIVLYQTEIVPFDIKIVRYDVEIINYDPENTVLTRIFEYNFCKIRDHQIKNAIIALDLLVSYCITPY
jgi:hypothetical protein